MTPAEQLQRYEDCTIPNSEWLFKSPEELEAQQKEKEEQQRLAFCGSWVGGWQPGQEFSIKSHPTFCHIYHKCTGCRIRKEAQMLDRLKGIDKKAKVITVDEKEAKKLIKKYGKEKVLRLPQENGEIKVIVKTDDEIQGSKKLAEESLAELSAIAPKGKSVSGSLGKASPPLTKKEKKVEPEELTPEQAAELFKPLKFDGTDEIESSEIICQQYRFNFQNEMPLTVSMIEEKVLEIVKPPVPTSVSHCQAIIHELEAATVKVMEQLAGQGSILFLYKKSYNINIESSNSDPVKKEPEKVPA